MGCQSYAVGGFAVQCGANLLKQVIRCGMLPVEDRGKYVTRRCGSERLVLVNR